MPLVSGGVPTRQRGAPKRPAVLGWVAAVFGRFLQFAVEPKIVGLLPHNATDVYVDCHPGGFIGGQHIFIRCKVSPDDLRAYIKEKGYNFRFDSAQINENSKYPDGGLGWPNEDGTSVLGSRCGNGLCDVDEYWSYNHIYTNNGGYRMFYDVRRQLFYYDWSSN